MEVGMVRKEIMEVYVTSGGEVYQDYNRAFEQNKREEIIDLMKKEIGTKYFLMDNEYELISNFICDKFEEIEEIVNE